MKNINIRIADWTQDRQILQTIRRAVFIEEQNVPETLEWDGQDADAFHFLASIDNAENVGTARLLKNGRIGRMAVLKNFRSQGIGTALMHAILALAKEKGLPSVYLHAQVSAIAFYQRFGFTTTGAEFSEAGIPHCKMRKNL